MLDKLPAIKCCTQSTLYKHYGCYNIERNSMCSYFSVLNVVVISGYSLLCTFCATA